MAIVYLNGEFLPEEEARVPVLDRGFIFGDGIYEVIPCYGGKPFRLAEHFSRLNKCLAEVRIRNPLDNQQWTDVFERVLAPDQPQDQSLYLQVTRGVAKRDHAIPKNIEPTVFVMANLMQAPAKDIEKTGVDAVSCVDNRWANCHIKSTSLLANILLKQQAVDQNAVEAILIRDGYVTEGSASNVFIVKNGVIMTPPKGEKLLPGITRDLIIELAEGNGLSCEQRDISEAELFDADEVWISSSLKEVLPVVNINGKPVATGIPGPVWKSLWDYYQAFKQSLRKNSS